MSHRQTCKALATAMLFALASGGVSATATKAQTRTHVSGEKAIASTTNPGTHSFARVTPFARVTAMPGFIAQATGNLLSSEQKAQLTRLPIPIVAPTDLPAGFRLVHAQGEAGSYANGDDDSGYAIAYQGTQNTCISISSSQDGARGLTKVSQVQTRFGLLTVYTEKRPDSQSYVSFLGIKGNPVLLSGGTIPDSTANGGWKRCRAVSLETYTRILKSLAVVK